MVDTFNRMSRKVPMWLVYVIGAIFPIWLFYQGVTGGLGVDPVKVMEHEMGERGLQLFVATLCISPLRKFAGINLIRFRRALGVITFFYILCHLLIWLVLDVQIPSQIWADILKRPYITVGMGAFVLMIPLAITSNNLSVRKMGAKVWTKLHLLTYPAAIFGAVHYVMLVRGWQIEPLIYLGVIIGLLALRRVGRKRRVVAAA